MGIKFYNLNLRTTGQFKIRRRVKPIRAEQAPYTVPEWQSEGFLGAYEFDDEVTVQLDFHDPSGVVTNFTLNGDLPDGVSFNPIGATISGFIEDEESEVYNFEVIMNTSRGDSIPQQFTIETVIFSSDIEWNTDSDLGSYGAGERVNQQISADVVESSN